MLLDSNSVPAMTATGRSQASQERFRACGCFPARPLQKLLLLLWRELCSQLKGEPGPPYTELAKQAWLS